MSVSALEFLAALDRLGVGLPLVAIYNKALNVLGEQAPKGWDNEQIIDAVVRATQEDGS